MLVGWRKSVSKCFIIPQRVVLAIMGFLGVMNAYTMRICLSVAIIEMVKRNPSSGTNDELECHASEGSTPSAGGDFEWSQELQGVILSSFYWGYVLTHIPGGILADKFGGKYTLCLGVLSTACFTLLTPLVINTAKADAPYYLIGLRVLMGIGEGTTFPALSALLSQWIPLKERSKLGALVFGGAQIGTILGNSVSGLLIHSFNVDVVFYFFGGMAVIYVILFILLCYSNPDSHPYISDEEKEYLKKELGTLKRDDSLPPTPWRAILTNAPMLALVCAQVGHDFGYFIMVTDLPKYMSDVLKFSIKENGLYSSLPYVLMWIVSLASGFLSDFLLTKGVISVTNARKLFTSFAAIGPAIFIVAASYAGCDQALVVVLFTIAMGIMGTYYAGMKVNTLDLSPNYAGTLMAITNGFAALTGIAGPYLVGVMTPDSSLLQWRSVFWVAFGFFIVTNMVYVIFASGEVQAFNSPVVANQSIEGAQDTVVATYDKEINDSKIK